MAEQIVLELKAQTKKLRQDLEDVVTELHDIKRIKKCFKGNWWNKKSIVRSWRCFNWWSI